MKAANEAQVTRALAALFSPANMPAAFPPDSPSALLSCEHQGGAYAKRKEDKGSGIHDADMLRLQNAIEATFLRADIRRGLPKERKMERKMGKYGMQHSGLGRAENKVEAVRITRYLLEQYGATTLLAVLDAAGKQAHDLCDAFLLALQLADAKAREGKLSFPFHVVGKDPGTRNLGVCVLELLGLQERSLRADGTRRAPLPVFRVLYWALVDLEAPTLMKQEGLDSKSTPVELLPYTIKVSLAKETPTLAPPAPSAELDDEMERELSFQANRQQAARKRRNEKAKEKRAAKRQKIEQ